MGEKSLLVVDDSILARTLIRNLVTQTFPGWHVEEARSAEEALRHLETHRPQVIFLDYHMPGIDGLELAARILAAGCHRNLHLVTANIQDKMRERAEALGIGFLMKPVSASDLSTIFSRLDPA